MNQPNSVKNVKFAFERSQSQFYNEENNSLNQINNDSSSCSGSQEELQTPELKQPLIVEKSKFVGINFKRLDDDFEIPEEKWSREKTMGAGAYGKVMECTYKPLGISFAVKRFESIFKDE